MVQKSPLKKLICIVGPTASGKTNLAIQLANQLSGEIINADSRQFYKELCIGTAKPSKKELAKAPHHLINCASIQSPWNAGNFVKAAHEKIHNFLKNQKVPIIVGGTGMYIQKLIFDIAKIPEISSKTKNEIENLYKENGLSYIYNHLKKLDPNYASKLHFNDTQRILRAYEVILQTGKSLTSFWEETKPLFDVLYLGIAIDREALYKKINDRVLQMIDNGLKREVEDLNQKYPHNEIIESTIGYAEWIKHNFIDDAKIISEIQKNSRQFAKRQITWFKNKVNVRWLDLTSESDSEIVNRFLKN